MLATVVEEDDVSMIREEAVDPKLRLHTPPPSLPQPLSLHPQHHIVSAEDLDLLGLEVDGDGDGTGGYDEDQEEVDVGVGGEGAVAGNDWEDGVGLSVNSSSFYIGNGNTRLFFILSSFLGL